MNSVSLNNHMNQQEKHKAGKNQNTNLEHCTGQRYSPLLMASANKMDLEGFKGLQLTVKAV